MKPIIRSLVVVGSLLVIVAAQVAPSACPITVTSKDGVLTYTNSGTKNIAAMVASTSTDGNRGLKRHDYYFNAAGFASGDFEISDMTGGQTLATNTLPSVSAVVTFVQFDDGSTWGDPDLPEVKEMFAWRVIEKKSITQLLSAYQSGGDQAFNDAVAALPTTAPERFIVRLANQLQPQGMDVVVANFNNRLAAAAIRDSTGKF